MFSDPQSNIQQFNIPPGSYVADLGSGSGFYTIVAARVVGPSGRVYSVEVQKDLLSNTKKDAQRERLYNVEAIWGNIEKLGGTRLRDASIDTVIIANVLFQIDDKETMAKEVRRITKKGGRVLIVDWHDTFGGVGPKYEMLYPPESAKTLLQSVGFEFEREIQAGQHHYGLIFKLL